VTDQANIVSRSTPQSAKFGTTYGVSLNPDIL